MTQRQKTAQTLTTRAGAPRLMWRVLGAGMTALLAGLGLATLASGPAAIIGGVVSVAAAPLLAAGLGMALYGLAGQARMRKFIIAQVAWRGDEQVLDIGTGQGGLLLAAAARLGPLGHVTGIDFWQPHAPPGARLAALAEKASAEAAGKVTLLVQDEHRLPCADGSVDVVLSLFGIGGIDSTARRHATLLEIVRVLKPGGRVLIGEFLPAYGYAAALRHAGLTVRSCRSHFSAALSLMWLVDAEKPRA